MHSRDYKFFAEEGFGKFEISGGVQTTWLYPALRILYIFLLYAFANIFNAHVYQNLLIILDGSINADFFQILEHIRGKYACFLF